jgi:O-acetyl-ADP-ribose deacetylase (regulator of RNase III)
MSQTFRTNTFRMESPHWKGDYNKLGTIDFARQVIDTHNKCVATAIEPGDRTGYKDLYVVNAYTQYRPGAATKPYSIPLDYDALRMCMRKLNHEFKGLKVGLCKIGCGLAGGDWKIASEIIKQELVDCDVEVLIKD